MIRRFADQAALDMPQVLFVAGKGNNGGDAFVSARELFQDGWAVQVMLAAKRSDVHGDAAEALEAMVASGLDVVECPDAGDWDDAAHPLSSVDVVVDALLGTGASGAPSGTVAAAIGRIQSLQSQAWIISVDIPSGLNGDSGQIEQPCVAADLTVTMGLPKRGLILGDAMDVRGSLECVDLGFSSERVTVAKGEDDLEWNAPGELAARIPVRARRAHKGDCGRVLVIGGSVGLSGAPALCAMGAVRAGAGLVTVLTPKEIAGEVAAHAPEVMVASGPANDEGGLSVDAWSVWRNRVDDFNAIVVGPGMGRHPDVLMFLRQLIRESEVPMILDADALNAFQGQPHWLDRARGPIAVTPHPGEMARLFGQSVEQIQSDRVGLATAAAKFSGITVVLKGADTVVAQPDGSVYINTSGNPGMASGGTGDVLAGMMAGLVAQGLDVLDAARLAVYLHGKAGDIASYRESQMAMTAPSLLNALPDALHTLRLR